MKLLYTIIILSLIQFCIIKPLSASSSTNNTTSLKDQLLDFYDDELQTIAKDFLIKAKNLCQQLLKDKEVQQASTPIMKEFKQNIADFLHAYPTYVRYNFISELVSLYDDKIGEIFNTTDSSYIRKLLKKQDYDGLNLEYQIKFTKFVKEKFLPKFEELTAELSPEELQQQKGLLNWFKGLKECENFMCMQNYFYILIIEDLTPKEALLEFIQEKLDYFNMFYGNTAYKTIQEILKDPKLSEISSPLRHQMIIDINDFTMKFESTQDMDDLLKITELFYNNILLRYYYNTDISAEDLNIIMDIFSKHGYDEFVAKYAKIFDDFLEHDLPVKIEEFKAAIIREALDREKPILEGFEELKSLNGDERHDKFYKVYALLKT